MRKFFVFLLWPLAVLPWPAWAHPTPDIPVRSYLDASKTMEVQVEVDPRCFEHDPDLVPYVTKRELSVMPEEQKAELCRKAAQLIREMVEFRFSGTGLVEPSFEFDFTTFAGKPLQANTDPVLLTGTWRTELPKTQESYFIRARPVGAISVRFLPYFEGKQLKKIAVLFPGELSYPLRFSEVPAMEVAAPEESAEDEKS